MGIGGHPPIQIIIVLIFFFFATFPCQLNCLWAKRRLSRMSYYRYITGVYKSYWPELNRTLRSSSVPRTVASLILSFLPSVIPSLKLSPTNYDTMPSNKSQNKLIIDLQKLPLSVWLTLRCPTWTPPGMFGAPRCRPTPTSPTRTLPTLPGGREDDNHGWGSRVRIIFVSPAASTALGATWLRPSQIGLSPSHLQPIHQVDLPSTYTSGSERLTSPCYHVSPTINPQQKYCLPFSPILWRQCQKKQQYYHIWYCQTLGPL